MANGKALGSIFVFASGNGGRNYDTCAYNGYANSIYTVTINSVRKDGGIPSFSEPCTAVMASTYSRDESQTWDSKGTVVSPVVVLI